MSTPTILITDANPDVIDFIKLTIGNLNYTMQTATSPVEAMTKFLTYKPVLVIADARLSNWKGSDMIRELRGQGFETKILMLVPYYADNEVAICTEYLLKQGADAVLKKEEILQKLEPLIRDLLKVPY